MGSTSEALTPEQHFLRILSEFAGGEQGVSVYFRDIQGHLALSDEQADYCCEYWTEQGVVKWSALGHVALTHLGAAKLSRLLGEDARSDSSTSDGTSDAGLDSVPDDAQSAGAGATTCVSVVIPVLNEDKTIGHIVEWISADPLVGEILVIDDGSIDRTPEIAAAAGAKVRLSSFLGKGASMEEGVAAASGDIILFLDGDLKGFPPDLVELMVEPLLQDEADMVKARFDREAGRVTILTARPLLGSFFPELAGFEQPLGGIVAAKRSLLHGMRMETDYGADVGLLIDASMKGAKIAQVDIGWIGHDSQPLESLADMAKQITRVIIDRAWRHGRLSINHVREVEELEQRTLAKPLCPALEPNDSHRFALLDMDGVLLDGRFIVALAAQVGVEDELERLLDNKMIPDSERTRLIAALFSGVYAETFEEVARTVPLMSGASEMVIGLRKTGYRVGIVTDSYHVAAEIVRRRVFADFCVAHGMHFRNGRSTGEVTLSPLMVDPDGCPQHQVCKANVMLRLRDEAGLVPEETLAVGDGENDICLLREVGLSVAFRPRTSAVAAAAGHTVRGSLLDILALTSDPLGPSRRRNKERERRPLQARASENTAPCLPAAAAGL